MLPFDNGEFSSGSHTHGVIRFPFALGSPFGYSFPAAFHQPRLSGKARGITYSHFFTGLFFQLYLYLIAICLYGQVNRENFVTIRGLPAFPGGFPSFSGFFKPILMKTVIFNRCFHEIEYNRKLWTRNFLRIITFTLPPMNSLLGKFVIRKRRKQ